MGWHLGKIELKLTVSSFAVDFFSWRTKMDEKVTVVTITYNRAHTIHRVFDSLMKQTYRSFIWLVIDDGSIDNTEDLINDYKKHAWFEIEYVKKKHAGKYEGANLSYKLIRTKYFTNCDSDDAMCPNGLEVLMNLWKEVPSDKYDKIWCVTARCIDSKTGSIVGDLFPKNINMLSGKKQLKAIKRTRGEKQSCRKLKIVKDFPFPYFEDTTKLVPDMSWIRIDSLYDQYCTNEVASIYYQDSADSLGKSPSKERKLAYFYFSVMLINEYFDQVFINKDVSMSFIHISRCGWRGGKTSSEIIKSVNGLWKKTLVIACMPISAVYNIFFDKYKKGIH